MNPYGALAEALRERLQVIGDRDLRLNAPDTQLARLQEISEKIARLAAGLPQPVDPQLAHFVQRCSYDKALAWIESHGAQ